LNVLIVCHGDPPSEALLKRELAQADLVLCTDGVALWLEGLGIVADFVIGDLDSLSGAEVSAPLVDAGPHELQDSSDSAKAVAFALERGAKRITLLGATGGRLDHTLANISLAAACREDAEVHVLDDSCDLQVLSGLRRLDVPAGAPLSIVPLTPDVRIRTEGLQWELDEPLELGTRGLSNRALAEEITIDVTEGLVALIIFHSAG